MIFKRSSDNPIFTRGDIPDHPPLYTDVSAVFNPGAVAFEGRICLLLRVQTRGRETHLLPAFSRDGRRFDIGAAPIELRGIEDYPGRVFHVYDPRLTLLEGRLYCIVAMDTEYGCRLGLAVSDDFSRFDLLSVDPGADRRNGVLFPERMGNRYLRLDRPNSGGIVDGSGDEILLSTSTDLLNWRNRASVARGRLHYWDELIGPGPPPVKTRAGWLLVYHGIATHPAGGHLYQAGVMLLDLDDPGRVIGRGRDNILEPRESYEITGQVPNVVFPSGMIVGDYDKSGFAREDGEVKLYYGAADTCVAMATSTVGALLSACRN